MLANTADCEPFDITQAKPGDIIRAHVQDGPDADRIVEITGPCERHQGGEVTITGRIFGDYPWHREQPAKAMTFHPTYVFSLVDA
jgi:hypothetical protein